MDDSDVLARGQAFHRQLFAQIGTLHPEDPAHDRAVGAAVLRAVQDNDPAGAVETYNVGAEAHGYAPIAWLGTFTSPTGRTTHWIDIRDAVIGVGSDFSISVLARETLCQ